MIEYRRWVDEIIELPDRNIEVMCAEEPAGERTILPLHTRVWMQPAMGRNVAKHGCPSLDGVVEQTERGFRMGFGVGAMSLRGRGVSGWCYAVRNHGDPEGHVRVVVYDRRECDGISAMRLKRILEARYRTAGMEWDREEPTLYGLGWDRMECTSYVLDKPTEAIDSCRRDGNRWVYVCSRGFKDVRETGEMPSHFGNRCGRGSPGEELDRFYELARGCDAVLPPLRREMVA